MIPYLNHIPNLTILLDNKSLQVFKDSFGSYYLPWPHPIPIYPGSIIEDSGKFFHVRQIETSEQNNVSRIDVLESLSNPPTNPNQPKSHH